MAKFWKKILIEIDFDLSSIIPDNINHFDAAKTRIKALAPKRDKMLLILFQFLIFQNMKGTENFFVKDFSQQMITLFANFLNYFKKIIVVTEK